MNEITFDRDDIDRLTRLFDYLLHYEKSIRSFLARKLNYSEKFLDLIFSIVYQWVKAGWKVNGLSFKQIKIVDRIQTDVLYAVSCIEAGKF